MATDWGCETVSQASMGALQGAAPWLGGSYAVATRGASSQDLLLYLCDLCIDSLFTCIDRSVSIEPSIVFPALAQSICTRFAYECLNNRLILH